MKYSAYVVNDEFAPITSALNARREMLFHELHDMAPGPEKIDNAINGLLSLMADVIVAVHTLETGISPSLGMEVEGFDGPDGK